MFKDLLFIWIFCLSSVAAFEELKEKGTDAVGTLRGNRKGISQELKDARLKKVSCYPCTNLLGAMHLFSA